MKFLVVVLLVALCVYESSATCGKPWKRQSLKAKYSPLIFNGFYDLPMSTESSLIKKEKWVKIASDIADLAVPGDLYCQENDPRVGIIFDKAGTVIGVRTSFLEKDVKDVQGYDFEAVNTYRKTNIFNETGYGFDAYFVDPETITESGVGERTETADGVWAYINGELVHLPIADPKIDNYNGFQRQNCFPQMGQHYFYGMNSSVTDCSKQVPLFGTYHNGELVGYGLANYGSGSKANRGRNWYESVPLFGAKLIMPDRPSCVDELIKQNGLYSLHVWFVDKPALIGCLFQ